MSSWGRTWKQDAGECPNVKSYDFFESDHFRFEFHCEIDCCDTEFSHLKLDTMVLFYSVFDTDIENNNSLPSI